MEIILDVLTTIFPFFLLFTHFFLLMISVGLADFNLKKKGKKTIKTGVFSFLFYRSPKAKMSDAQRGKATVSLYSLIIHILTYGMCIPFFYFLIINISSFPDFLPHWFLLIITLFPFTLSTVNLTVFYFSLDKTPDR